MRREWVTQRKESFRVGERLVTPSANEIDGVRVDSKAMDVLVELAAVAPDVVTTEYLLETVWPNVVVVDNVVYQAVAQLRRALGDDAREPQYIETVPRRGYRLIAPVEQVLPIATVVQIATQDEPPAKPENGTERRDPPLPSRSRRPVLIATAVLLVAAAVAIAIWIRLDPKTIAVLPFDAPADGDVWIYGLPEEIRVSLNNAGKGVHVVPGIWQPLRPEDSPQEIGRKLHAGSLLFGNVRHDGDQLKVTVWLVDANTGIQRWSKSEIDSLPANLFQLQARIAHEVADQIVPELAATAGAADNIDRPSTNDLEAYTEFLEARLMLHRRGIEPIESSIKLFNDAIARDPKFGRAYVGLAEALIVAPSYTGEPEAPMYDRATAALDRAEALGATQSPAPAIRAYIDTRRWRWFDAAKEFEAALASDPYNSDLRQYYSQFLAYTGDLQGATEQAKQATALDPLSPIAHQRLGVMYLWVNDDRHASREFALAKDLGLSDEANPEAMVVLYLWNNHFDKARALLIDTQKKRDKSDAWIGPAIQAVAQTGSEAEGVAALRTAHTNAQINDRLYFGALLLIGDPESFFPAMNDAVTNHNPFDVEMLFMERSSALRRQPRFASLMEQIGLVAYWDANRWPAACAREGTVVACH